MAPTQRNPRYIILIIVLVIGALYLFSRGDVHTTFYEMKDPSLLDRIMRSERIYQNTVKSRQEMIRKFGPNPEEVVMFPPDKNPWPAYTAWDFFPPSFNCPHERERLGSLGDGGKWLCGLSRIEQKPDCIVYSLGVSGSSSFEGEVLARTRFCQIWAYDPQARSLGREVSRSLRRSRSHFKPFQLADQDAHSPKDSPKLWKLKTLMDANGHKHIDVLKIDLEGWEFQVMTSFLRPYLETEEPLPIGQLLLEIHTWNKHFPELLQLFKDIESAGFRPFMRESNLIYTNYNRASDQDLMEYSFINTQGSNSFIEDPVPHNVHGERPS